MGQSIKYRVNTRWFFHNELQKVPSATAVKFRKEEKEKVVLKVKPGVKKKKPLVAVRRSSRIRKPVSRLGMIDYTKK